jgi:hypothetical protein
MSTNLNKTALATRLTRHFAAGAAIAAATPFMTTDTASAAVQYSAVNLSIPATIDGLYINVQTLATGSAGSVVAGWDINPYSETSLTWFNATGTGMLRFPGVTTGSAGNLAVGTIVGATGSYGSGAVTVGTAAGNWQLNSINRFGFRFIAADGLTHYGWGTMVVGAAITNRTITEIAWETVAATPISVGDTGGGSGPYDPCAATNPTVSVGANSLFMRTDATVSDLASGCGTIYKANYYKFTAPATRNYDISTCASAGSSAIAVLNGCAAGSSVVACGTACGASGSIVTLSAIAGGVYYIVAGSSVAGVDLANPFAVQVTPWYDPCDAANPSVGLGANNLAMASNAPNESIDGLTFAGANYFRFNPPFSGDWTFSTCASAAATRMAILSGCAAGSSVIASNDSFCGSSAELTVSLTGGVAVYFVLGGDSAALTSPQSVIVSGPGTSCATAAVANYGVNSISSSAGSGPDQVVFTSAAQSATATATIYNAQWFSFTPTGTGNFTFKACNSGDTKIAIGTACVASGTFGTIAYNDDAPTCATASGGTSFFGSWIDSTNNGGGGLPLTQPLVAGTTYFICIGGYADATVVSGGLEISGPGGGPYDPCGASNPTAAPGTNTLGYDSTAADLNLGGACSFVIYGANYYKYTPTVSGSHTFDTCASGSNTRMAVLDSCAAGAAVLGCNDDSCGLSSAVTLDLTLGVPVYVVVGSWASTNALGPILGMQVTLPPLPECVNAADAVYGDNAISSAGLTADPVVYTNVAQNASAPVFNAQWFAFTPTATGAFTIKACNSGDTRLAIGTVCPGTGGIFSTIAYSDDAPTCFTVAGGTNAYGSWIDLTNNGATGGFAGFPLTQDLVAGTTYYICVGGFSDADVVSGFLNIAGPQGSACPADLDGDGTVGAPDLANLLGAWGGPGAADLDGDGFVGAPDLANLLGAWGACP